jgi:pilus assembly protein CpaC
MHELRTKQARFLGQSLLAAVAALLALALPEVARAQQILDLVAGQQKVLSVAGVTRIAIANPNVADVRVVSAGEVLVTAGAIGQTELTVWQGARVTKYTVNVISMDPTQLKREIERLLTGREGVVVRLGRDNQVIIEGEVQTLADRDKIEEVTKLYPQARSVVKLDPTAHAQLAEAINRELEHAGLAGARASVVSSTLFLEGVVDSEADLKKAEIVTHAITDNVQIMLTVGAARLIELDVEFVEVSKNSLDRIGINWPTDVNATLDLQYAQARIFKGEQPDSQSLTASVKGGASFGFVLQFNDGITRTLARPRLVTASSKEASFLAGGEIPIPIVTQQHTYIEYKEYGIRLKITPTVDGSGTIRAKVLTEVSQLDEAVSVMGVPGFLSRRVDTEVTLRDGETIVLSGLAQSTEGKDVTKVPILAHIPILGELFKSRRFLEHQTELVIFVTPRVVDPLSRELRDLSSTIHKHYEEAAADLGFGILD